MVCTQPWNSTKPIKHSLSLEADSLDPPAENFAPTAPSAYGTATLCSGSFFHVYEDLPTETKARIPLKQPWILDEDAIL